MTWFAILFGLIALAALAMGILTRRLTHDAGVWHVDPLNAPKPATPNSYRVGPDGTTDADAAAPEFDLSAAELATAFDRVARAADSDVVSGSAAEGWVTYVETSDLFAFPDYISAKFIERDGGGSTLAVFSRSRLGRSDLGVNKKRVESWLSQLG